MEPVQRATGDAGSSPKQRKVMTSQEAELLAICHRLMSATAVAHHFNINESSIRTIVKKKSKFMKPLL